MAARVLSAVGTPNDIAEEVAAHLVEADCVGHSSHGISRLPFYLQYIDDGIVRPGARPRTVAEDPVTLVSAEWGFSHVAARLAVDAACDAASEKVIGVAGLVRGTHIGRLGAYMERAAARGCAALAFAGGLGGQRRVAPFGGRAGLLGSNPLAAGFPTASGPPIVVDFSTAAAPVGKVMVARLAGERMPSLSLVDEHGEPTDDPNVLWEGGAMRTFGDHKGFGLAVMIELFGRVLLGAKSFADGAGGGEIFGRQGLLVVAIAADAFQGLDDVVSEAAELRQLIRDAPPASGFDRVLAPGDPEQELRGRRADAFPIEVQALAAIRDAARDVGVLDGPWQAAVSDA